MIGQFLTHFQSLPYPRSFKSILSFGLSYTSFSAPEAFIDWFEVTKRHVKYIVDLVFSISWLKGFHNDKQKLLSNILLKNDFFMIIQKMNYNEYFEKKKIKNITSLKNKCCSHTKQNALWEIFYESFIFYNIFHEPLGKWNYKKKSKPRKIFANIAPTNRVKTNLLYSCLFPF